MESVILDISVFMAHRYLDGRTKRDMMIVDDDQTTDSWLPHHSPTAYRALPHAHHVFIDLSGTHSYPIFPSLEQPNTDLGTTSLGS